MKDKNRLRGVVLGIFLGVLFLILIVRLFYLQIVRGEEYAENFSLRIKREITLPGTRGNIYDRNGVLLAGNELAWAVTLEDQENYNTDRERALDLNGKIYRVTEIIKEHGDSVEHTIPVWIGAEGKYEFSEEGFALERFQADVYGRATIEEMTQEERTVTAAELIALLEERFCVHAQDGKKYTLEEKRRYGLPETLSQEEILDLVNIRYALSLQSYQKYLAVTVAGNVSEETAAAVRESQAELPGVNIRKESIRVYPGGEAFGPVMGYTGRISEEELSEKSGEKDGDRYTTESVVGKSEMEQYLDEMLQGKDGKQEVYIDNLGKVTEDLGVTEEPGTGKDVFLSIDAELQQETYEILERKIADILLENLIDARSFDETEVGDTTEIRIPVYDVYAALMTNGKIDRSHFQAEEASENEREAYHIFTGEKEQVKEEIRTLLGNTGMKYRDMDLEQQTYADLVAGEISNMGDGSREADSEILALWESGELSLREYMYGAVEEGWLDPAPAGAKGEYLTGDEICDQLSEVLLETASDSGELDEIIYKNLVLSDTIPPEQVCMILYEQGELNMEDGDFEQWRQGAITTFELIRQKLQNLEITPTDLALDPCSGSAVVTDTDTGAVLACVSYPGYDGNRLANQMDENYYYKIYNNDSLPLYNRATQQLSAPGSTFKPVTVAAGLEEGVIDTGTQVVCDGVFDKVSPPLKCWNTSGHGSVNSAAESLENSCNDYLCEISWRLGMMGSETYSDDQALAYIQKYSEMFDLDKKSGIELEESEPQVTDSYAIPSAIGQGTHNFATVQLARYAAALANGGTVFRLTLIDSVDGVKKESVTEKKVELAESTWDAVHTGMEMYAGGTGLLDGIPVSAAGKSGTAQEVRTRPDHGLFIGYAPAEEPEIAVAVRIVNGYEAAGAVECAKEIFDSYFKNEDQPVQ